MTATRAPAMSARLKLTLSYAGFLMVTGVAMLLTAWVVLLRSLPDVGVIVGQVLVRSVLERNFVATSAVVLVILLAVGLLGGWWLAGRMLAPLGRLTDATRRAAAGSLSHRIELSGPHDEFHELADAFDAMLARLEAHDAEQQRFAANASHELRTPLAITQALLEVARRDPASIDLELIDRLHEVNARAIELTEALLLLSRADQGAFTQEVVDLALMAEDATETLLPLAGRQGVTITSSGGVALALGSPPLLLQLATNLVHNAIVHNGNDHGRVWVTTGVQGGEVTLTVENTGEVLPAELVVTLAEPFRRGTDRTRAGHPGVGLGLAIVDSIARAHHGRVALAPRTGGGLHATVHLPRAP